MGNSNNKQRLSKPLTTQELASRLEASIVRRSSQGLYTARFPAFGLKDILMLYQQEGFVVTVANEVRELKQSALLFLEDPQLVQIKMATLSWKDATTGRAKLCRDKADAYWASRTSALKFNLLKTGEEEGEENDKANDTAQASAPLEGQ